MPSRTEKVAPTKSSGLPEWLFATFVEPTLQLQPSDPFAVRLRKTMLVLHGSVLPVILGVLVYISLVFANTDDEHFDEPDWILTLVAMALSVLSAAFCLVYVYAVKRAETWACMIGNATPLLLFLVFPTTFPLFPVQAATTTLSVVSMHVFAPPGDDGDDTCVERYAGPLLSLGYAAAHAIHTYNYNAIITAHPHWNETNIANTTRDMPFFFGTRPHFDHLGARWFYVFLGIVFAAIGVLVCVFVRESKTQHLRARVENNAAVAQMRAAASQLDVAGMEAAVAQIRDSETTNFGRDSLQFNIGSVLEQVKQLARFANCGVLATLRQQDDASALEAPLERRDDVVVLVACVCNVSRLMDVFAASAGSSEAAMDAVEALLCEMSQRVAEIIASYDGLVVQQDASMTTAVFGAPTRLHVRHAGTLAACAALHIKHVMNSEFAPRAERAPLRATQFRLRIGIARGSVLLGNVGTGDLFASAADDGDGEIEALLRARRGKRAFSSSSSSSSSPSRDKPSAPLFPRLQYVVAGEAVQIALAVASLGSNRATTSTTMTREVLLPSSGMHAAETASVDALQLNFAARELCLFTHDQYAKVHAAVQLVGLAEWPLPPSQRDRYAGTLAAARRVVMYQTTPAIDDAAFAEKRQQWQNHDELGRIIPALELVDWRRRFVWRESDSDTDRVGESDDDTSSSTSSGRLGGESMRTSSGNSALESASTTTSGGSSSWGIGGGDYDPRCPAAAAASSDDSSGSLELPHHLPMYRAQKGDLPILNHRHEHESDKNCGGADGYVRLSVLEAGPAPLPLPANMRAVEEQRKKMDLRHAEMVRRCVETVIVPNFLIDDAAADVLRQMTHMQTLFAKAARLQSREALREAMRVCRALRSINAVAPAASATATAQPASVPINPNSSPLSLTLLSRCGVDQHVLELFFRRCRRLRPDIANMNGVLKVQADALNDLG